LKKGPIKSVDVMGMKKPIVTRSSNILLVGVPVAQAVEAEEGDAAEATVEAAAVEGIVMRQH